MPQTGKSAVSPDQSVVLRYAGASMAALAALGVRMALDPMLGTQAPYVPFILAIVVASRYGGRGPALAATAISGLAVDWFYLQPLGSLAIADTNAAVGLALFLLTGVIISFFVGRLRKSLLSAARAEPALQQTGEQIHLSPGSAVAGRGTDRKLKPHYLWLGAAVVLLAIEALLFFATWTRFSEREDLSTRTREVLAKIESLLSELKDAETGQRGYLLIGRDSYLEPYDTALREIPGQLDDLRKLNLDQGQQARIVSLQPLIATKLAELKETIDLRRTGAAAAALQVLSSDRGKQTMDQIRDVIVAMRTAEASLLEERSGRAAAAAEGMIFVMASGAGLLLIVLLAGSRNIDRNLTRRRQAEKELRESEVQFRTLANAIPTLCWMANGDGWITWYNERWYEYTGTTPEQMEGWGWQSVHDPEALPAVMERWQESIATATPFEMVFPLRGADGAFRPFLTRIVPVRGEDGKVAQWFGTNTDITERQRMEDALRQSLGRLERVLEVETVGVVFWDLNTGCMVDANGAFLKLMGYSRSEVEARELTWQKLTPPEYMDPSRAEVEKFMATGRVGPYEKEFFRKDGTRLWLLFAGSSLGNNQCVEFCVDISERKKAEAALRESERQYRGLFESMHEAFLVGELIFDANGKPQDWRYLDVNPRFENIYGLRREQIVGKTYREVLPGPWSDYWIEKAGRVALTGEPAQFESYGNTGLYLEGSVYRPRPGQFAATIVDGTARHKAEEAVRRMSALVESSNDAIIGKTLDGIITSWNSGATLLYGYEALEVVGRNISVLVPPDQPDEVPELLRRVAQGEQIDQYEAIRRRKDGSLVYVSLKISPIRDASGSVAGASSIARDITERKQAEEARAQTTALLEGILVSIPEPVMVMDEDGHMVKSNNVFERRHLTTVPGTLGQYYPAVDLFTEDGHPVPNEMWPLNRAIKGERISGLTLRLTFGSGGPSRFYRHSANPIYDRNGRVTHAVLVFFDVTDNRLAEEEIRRLNIDLEDRVRRRTTQLEAANKELEAFAYSVSHDLRTPLRGIDGWSLALVEDYGSQLDEKAHGYVDRVRAEAQRMGSLIDDLLQLSRVSRSEMAAGAVDLTSIARTIAARLTEANSGRRIEFTIAGGLAANGDARLLEIALDNLFGNAVKFSGQRAEARVEFGRAERDGERPFYVRDNGVGFDMAFAGTLFGAFQRLHRASEFPGTGIGLATVQRIIHRHGGRVWAEAQPGLGATFYFTLIGKS